MAGLVDGSEIKAIALKYTQGDVWLAFIGRESLSFVDDKQPRRLRMYNSKLDTSKPPAYAN